MSSTTSTPSSSTTISTASPSCTTATPGKYGYVPPDACNSYWAYSPSFEAAIAFSVLFGILTVAQLCLAIMHRKPFCWVIIMGAVWELIAFVTRAFGSHNQQSLPFAFVSTIFFLLAPLWINAYVYMTAGRLIWTFKPEKRVWKIKALSIGKYFVWLDIVSFLIQVIGGMMLSPGGNANTMKTGQNIYMTGVGIQQLFICIFTGLIVLFYIEVRQLEKSGMTPATQRWKWVTIGLFFVLALITMRIIYRLIEFSAGAGTNNPLPYHEIYALVLDAVPMVLALTVLSVLHPGVALQGPESEFPSRKERKAAKKAAKAEKKLLKEQGKGLTSDTVYAPVHTHENSSSEDIEMGQRV